MSDLLNIYELEKTCEYRGEIYHVRDSGSILRCQKLNKRKRPLDEKWTFGKPILNNYVYSIYKNGKMRERRLSRSNDTQLSGFKCWFNFY